MKPIDGMLPQAQNAKEDTNQKEREIKLKEKLRNGANSLFAKKKKTLPRTIQSRKMLRKLRTLHNEFLRITKP